VWISRVGKNSECKNISSSCNSINEKETCKTEGAAMNDDITLTCLWIEGSGSDTDSGKCMLKV
jgi:hypothetical protein